MSAITVRLLEFAFPVISCPTNALFQKHFQVGHADLARNAVGLKVVRQSRTPTKTEQISSFLISIVVIVQLVAVAIVIVPVAAGWPRAQIHQSIQVLLWSGLLKLSMGRARVCSAMDPAAAMGSSSRSNSSVSSTRAASSNPTILSLPQSAFQHDHPPWKHQEH